MRRPSPYVLVTDVRSDGYGMMSTDTQQMTAAGSALSNGYHPGSEKHGDQYQIPHPPPPNVAGVYYDASDMTTNTNPYLQVGAICSLFFRLAGFFIKQI